MARAVVATAYGGAEVLEVVDVEVPAPGEGEVLVEVRAAGFNPADWKVYGGLWGADPEALPRRVGMEAAGVVSAVGPGVDLEVGQEVVVHPAQGAFSELLLARASAVHPKPAGLDWDTAAGLLLAGSTAWHCLEAVGLGEGRHEGEVLLVHGGAGSVGSLVVQLAVARGARVLATGSERSTEYIASLGATPLRYGEGLLERVRRAGAPTAAVDTVGTDEALEVSMALVPPLRMATIAGFRRGAELGVRLLGAGGDPGTQVRRASKRPLLEMAAHGELTVRVAGRFGFSRIREAHELLVSGHAPGKVVVVPD